MSRSPASSTSRCAPSAFETSAWTARPPMSLATASASSAPALYPTTTDAPALPSSTAIARPMPRDPPVTRAVRPSREQKSGSGDGLLGLLEPGEVVDRDRRHGPVDPLHEPAEHVARPDLDEDLDALLDEAARRLREPHRGGQLLDEERREALRGLEFRRHGRHERRDRVAESHPLDRGPEPIRRASDEWAVERPGDLQLDRAPRAELLGLGADLADGVLLSRDDDLPWAVVVGGPHAFDVMADLLDELVVETEDRRHRAVADPGRLGHREPTLTHECDRLERRQ